MVDSPPLVLTRGHSKNPAAYYQSVGLSNSYVLSKLHDFLKIPEDKQKDKCYIFKAAYKKIPTYIDEKSYQNGVKKYCE